MSGAKGVGAKGVCTFVEGLHCSVLKLSLDDHVADSDYIGGKLTKLCLSQTNYVGCKENSNLDVL